MFRLLGYLKQTKGAVIMIICLLLVQAYCDLGLPSYTSDIVDVGIQQGGIEFAAPEEMRAETWNNLLLLMTDEEQSLVEQYYVADESGHYNRTTDKREELEKLHSAFSIPMMMLESVRSMYDMETIDLPKLEEQGMFTREQVLEQRESMLSQLEDMSGAILDQRAVSFVKAEYEAMGLDLATIQRNYLLKTGAKMLGFTLIMIISAIGVSFLASRAAATIGRNLRGRVFERVLSFSNGEMNKFSTASLITRSTNDIQQVQFVSVMLLRMVIYAPILGVGGILKVIGTKTGMAWIIAVAVGLVMLLVGILVSLAMPKFKIMQSLVDGLNLVTREILTGVSVIRAFSREKYEEKRFDKANTELMKTQLFTNRVMTFMMPAMMLLMNGVTVMIVWFGAKGIDAGNLQVGDMMAFMTYTMQIVMGFLMLTMLSIMLPRAGVAADRIEEVLHTEPTILDAETTKDDLLAECKGEIRFENVSFAYSGAEDLALENISFTARPGETTAIIGSTGCGKSTLLNLIPRLYDVTEGRITLDGIDIRELSQHKLRSVIGLVPQKGVLFSGTIASNIKLAGEESISDEEMIDAAQTAQAVEFIDEKTEKYESAIAQGGSNVSGGQKQRLAIARAIAKHPKIYLFDDSFSALDYKTDAVLRKALREKSADATVLIVAQRISTIMHADQILVLDGGRIVGQGTHEQLLQNCAEYQEIANSQLSASELKGGA
ncbi:MAG: ABC transporter ATP-binding protein/permease [Acetatifactor sp.]|nr:ABC transporter ATP-binding protein/permease [Acetatifactor sp.]